MQWDRDVLGDLNEAKDHEVAAMLKGVHDTEDIDATKGQSRAAFGQAPQPALGALRRPCPKAVRPARRPLIAPLTEEHWAAHPDQQLSERLMRATGR